MKPFEYLPHTSEVKFKAYGLSIEEAFTNSAKAFTHILTDVHKIQVKEEKEIELQANSLKSLFSEFLNEELLFIDTDGFLTCDVKNLKIKQVGQVFQLRGVLLGDHYKNYETSGDIKAVTHYQMEVEESDDGWVCQAVLDV